MKFRQLFLKLFEMLTNELPTLFEKHVCEPRCLRGMLMSFRTSFILLRSLQMMLWHVET